MKSSIVVKWFALTVLLFSTLVLLIGFAQNYLFEEYYIYKKTSHLKSQMAEFPLRMATVGAEAAARQFWTADQIWITILDELGQIADVESYYIEVQDETGDVFQIPLYPFEGQFSTDVLSVMELGDQVFVDYIIVAEGRVPYLIQTDRSGAFNLNLANRLHGPEADPAYGHLRTGVYRGTVTKTVLPDRSEDIPFPYQDRFFMQQIKEFQVGLLAGSADPPQSGHEFQTAQNLVEYQVVIEPYVSDGEQRYIFAMTSLQPVGEAIAVMREFYPYMIVFTLFAVVVLALAFSRWLTKPLLAINQVTGKIAQLDFSEKLPIRSQDEIGELSQNINYLSEQMEGYITKLQRDLDKERQLESVRKEFIAGVSHELKTPLAVIRSCLSILRDGIAAEKRDHYFEAMENEVQRMDSLVVNMLDLAKFESGTYRPDMNPFRIDLTISEVCQSLAEQMKGKDLNIDLRLSPWTVIGHEGLVNRVISNFLSNAIRHTPPGKTITVSTDDRGEWVEISAANQGSQILEGDLQKIWTQFYRGEERSSKSGTGLGLSISKEILELHQASYGVENTDDGVRFFFCLCKAK